MLVTHLTDLELGDKLMSIVLPFDNESLWGLLQDNNIEKLYDVDVEASIAKGTELESSFVYYISNVGLNCHLNSVDKLTYEQKHDLIVQYLDINKIYYCRELTNTLGSIMMRFKGLDVLENSLFNENDCDQFIEQHTDLVMNWATFLDSCILYYMFQFKNVGKNFNKEQYPQVETVDIPLNIVLLFEVQEFTGFWTIVNPENLMWFPKQFESCFFVNNSLAKYIFGENNIVAAYMYHLDNQGE